jgi:alcohol dehydrogenase, propanol-preferring
MRAIVLERQGPIELHPLREREAPTPEPGPGEVLLRVRACGVCHTDLHVVEGDLPAHRLPLVPGHQVVGVVERVGEGATRPAPGQRVGVAWLASACGECPYCLAGRENLCGAALFTGYDRDGGFAEYATARAGYCVPLPEGFDDVAAAPLLCAGIVGYRALRLSGACAGESLALYGFGASAHVTIQVARHLGIECRVVSRSAEHRAHAGELGASWAGTLDDAQPCPAERAIVFAPAGELVPEVLRRSARGATVVLAGIHMSPLPEMPYELLWGERCLRSVANATRQDAHELMDLAGRIPIRTDTQTYALGEANGVLSMLKEGRIRGAAVLVP